MLSPYRFSRCRHATAPSPSTVVVARLATTFTKRPAHAASSREKSRSRPAQMSVTSAPSLAACRSTRATAVQFE